MGCGFLADGAASGERGGGGHSPPQTNSSSSSSSEVVALSQKRLLQPPPPLQASLRRPPAEWTTLKLAPDSTILYLALSFCFISLSSLSSSFAHLASRKSGFPDVNTTITITIVHLSSFSLCRRRNRRIVCLIGCEICLNIVAFVAD